MPVIEACDCRRISGKPRHRQRDSVAAISIRMHLLAHAASLPAWMQLLHPVATVIANSKLLVLPAYPVAWPQAKKHVWAQGTFRYLHRMAELDSMRKTAHRYQQTKQAFAQSGDLGVWMKYIKSRHLGGDNQDENALSS